jgi:hypothetical protein
MKEFFKEVEEARDLADKIDAKINEVKKLQNDILSSPKVPYSNMKKNVGPHQKIPRL